MAIAGCGVGWLAAQLKWKIERTNAIDRLFSQHPRVNCSASPSHHAPWQIRFLGAKGYETIAWISNGDSDIAFAGELERLFPEAKILPLDVAEYDERYPHWDNGRRIRRLQ